jgi:transposase-like protein
MIKNTSPILSALRVASQSEALAVAFLEEQRWADAPACPRCGDANVYRMTSEDGSRNKDYRWRCKGCQKMFTVRTGTVLEESRLPVRVWVYAFWRACASKKGISALQLARELEITHKSALFVLRRIRFGIGYDPKNAPKMKGTVEVDETYVGGKPRYRRSSKDMKGVSPTEYKIPVLAMVQRDGDVRFRAMERVTALTLNTVLSENADLSCRLITDQLHAYIAPGKGFKGGHESVNHHQREYARFGTDVHNNTVESVFSLIKRGIMGTWHSVSKKHLPNYLSEFEFRYNNRTMTDGERVAKAIKKIDGKRLTYRQSIDNPPYAPKPLGQAEAPFEAQE